MTKVPTNKRKKQKVTSSKDETEKYALFIEIPKKKTGKKVKLTYEQHGPWEFQTCLSWAEFCAAIGKEMHCTSNALDIDSFSWRSKPTGNGVNVGNELGYKLMISRIHVMPPTPVPNVYLVMNPPRASGKLPVSLSHILFWSICADPVTGLGRER
jgi:hypothetical protein